MNAVRTAIKRLLPGFVNPRVRRQPLLRMTVEKNGKKSSVGPVDANGKKVKE